MDKSKEKSKEAPAKKEGDAPAAAAKDAPVAKKPEDKKPEDKAAPAMAPKKDEPAAADGGGIASDVESLKKMVTEVLGEEGSADPEAMKMAQDCYEICMELGYSEEDAMKATSDQIKIAKKMGEKKMAEEAAGGGIAEAAAPDSLADQVPLTKNIPKDVEVPAMAESDKEVTRLKTENTALVAENLKLKESAKKIDIDKHLESILKESKLPVAATKTFRKLVEKAKTIKEIDEQFAVFKEAFSSDGTKESEGSSASGGFAAFLEKGTGTSTAEGGKGFEQFVG